MRDELDRPGITVPTLPVGVAVELTDESGAIPVVAIWCRARAEKQRRTSAYRPLTRVKCAHG